jgi:hypothetical protein
MNSLPMISHHLFVAAASNEPEGQPEPARSKTSQRGAIAVPLEVLDSEQPLPAGGLRRLAPAVVKRQIEATA